MRVGPADLTFGTFLAGAAGVAGDAAGVEAATGAGGLTIVSGVGGVGIVAGGL